MSPRTASLWSAFDHLGSPSEVVGLMASAVYKAEIAYPPLCPRALAFDSATTGLHCSACLPETGQGIEIVISTSSDVIDWDESDISLGEADDEADRIVAALCFRYVAPYRRPRRTSPEVPGRVTQTWQVRLRTFEDEWPAQLAELSEHLPDADPRLYPLWQVLASVGGASDPLSQFIALWGLLDVGLQADEAGRIDSYLFQRFGVPRDCPDRDGRPNRETRYAHLRHRISHPHGRNVRDVAALATEARTLVPELTDYCRIAVVEDFGQT